MNKRLEQLDDFSYRRGIPSPYSVAGFIDDKLYGICSHSKRLTNVKVTNKVKKNE